MDRTNNRWFYVVIGIVLFLFLGMLYAWSLFISPLEKDFGWTRAQTSLIFTISIIFFCLGGMAGGFITGKKSPGFTILISAVFLLCGFAASSQINSLTGIYITYGVISGFGIGLSYNAVISTVTRWFPDKTGAISGLLLMGFGFGGMLLGSTANELIKAIGWRQTFLFLGIAFGIIVFIGSRLLVLPPSNYAFPKAAAKAKNADIVGMEINSSSMIKRPTFWIFLIWSILSTAMGLALIGHAAPFANDLKATASLATFGVGLISVCNGLGRVILGAVCDRIGLKKTMTIINTTYITAIVILIAAVFSKSIPLLLLGFVFTGLSYGGVPTMNTVFASVFYGKKYFAQNLGIVNTSLIGAAFIGPYVAGTLRTATGSYLSTLYAMAVLAVAAFIANVLIKRP
ncbi:MFS transporter [Methanosarcina sp. UBA5]|uniref:MFS transporter n=1 Tax=Methanosarcina sp. UBA5 TaxID=1915593 RepID=UPI0025D801C5|nr:MFS transporter [Methanosarcina sp. UBA5]